MFVICRPAVDVVLYQYFVGHSGQ